MVMDSDAEPHPEGLRELRILVIHNSDFDSEPEKAGGELDLTEVSRADVQNAAQSVARALVSRGHFVEVQPIDRDDIPDLLARLQKDRPDLVFNLCESLGKEDRHMPVLPSLLELHGIPYTGSGPLCLELCGHKHYTKQILRAAGLPTPLGALLPARSRSRADDLAAVQGLGYPLFLKYAYGGGSIGITSTSIVHNDEAFIIELKRLRDRSAEPILVEQFIEGREIYVAMLGSSPPQLLPIRELDFSTLPKGMPPIVSQEIKWSHAPEMQAITSTPAAPMPPAVQARVEEVAVRTFAALEVCDYARCDIRLSRNGTPYIIDVNSNCDLSEDAGYARAGAQAGLGYDELIEKIALSALQRCAPRGESDGLVAETTSRAVTRSSRKSATAA